MKLSGLDTLVLMPVIPVVPILVTWWLPWERWVPWRKIPKAILGPYVLYIAYAAWYFDFDPWIVAMPAVWGLVLSVMAVVQAFRKKAKNV